MFEGLVAQLLRAYRDYRGAFDEMFYWSPTSSQTEVDFVLLRGDRAIAIEVKSGGRFSQKWCRGVRAIAALPNLCRRIVVCPEGETMQTEDGVDILPFRALAEALSSDSLWP